MSYSSTLGRWIQQDPAGYVDGVNAYQYVRGSPTTLVDPSGLEAPGTQPTSQPTSQPTGIGALKEAKADIVKARFEAQKRLALHQQRWRDVNKQIMDNPDMSIENRNTLRDQVGANISSTEGEIQGLNIAEMIIDRLIASKATTQPAD
jgi:uncharacterized protein RhaS with RHS repeats